MVFANDSAPCWHVAGAHFARAVLNMERPAACFRIEFVLLLPLSIQVIQGRLVIKTIRLTLNLDFFSGYLCYIPKLFPLKTTPLL